MLACSHTFRIYLHEALGRDEINEGASITGAIYTCICVHVHVFIDRKPNPSAKEFWTWVFACASPMRAGWAVTLREFWQRNPCGCCACLFIARSPRQPDLQSPDKRLCVYSDHRQISCRLHHFTYTCIARGRRQGNRQARAHTTAFRNRRAERQRRSSSTSSTSRRLVIATCDFCDKQQTISLHLQKGALAIA